ATRDEADIIEPARLRATPGPDAPQGAAACLARFDAVRRSARLDSTSRNETGLSESVAVPGAGSSTTDGHAGRIVEFNHVQSDSGPDTAPRHEANFASSTVLRPSAGPDTTQRDETRDVEHRRVQPNQGPDAAGGHAAHLAGHRQLCSGAGSVGL